MAVCHSGISGIADDTAVDTAVVGKFTGRRVAVEHDGLAVGSTDDSTNYTASETGFYQRRSSIVVIARPDHTCIVAGGDFKSCNTGNRPGVSGSVGTTLCSHQTHDTSGIRAAAVGLGCRIILTIDITGVVAALDSCVSNRAVCKNTGYGNPAGHGSIGGFLCGNLSLVFAVANVNLLLSPTYDACDIYGNTGRSAGRFGKDNGLVDAVIHIACDIVRSHDTADIDITVGLGPRNLTGTGNGTCRVVGAVRKAAAVTDDTTEIGVEISSAADLVKFAQDFNSGVYADRGDLVATLTQDITFDAESSAAFNATGGIGRKAGEFEAAADNYFFGAFNGASHTISGLTVNVPLFAYTNSDAVIENLNLDNTCVLTVTAPSVRKVYGPLVGRNKGIVRNCNSAAKVDIYNIDELVNNSSLDYGGLVGRNYGGSIEDCTVSGIVACPQVVTVAIDNADNSGNSVRIAGISGSQANDGVITRTNFTGEITISDGTATGALSATYSYTDGSSTKSGGQYFYIGGIAGYVESGSISHCNASVEGASKAIDVRGTFVPGIGGIAGWVKIADVQISDCHNYMPLSFTSAGARANASPARVGGIAGRSAGSISNSHNYGPITTLCNST